jgi:hypothetical protein
VHAGPEIVAQIKRNSHLHVNRTVVPHQYKVANLFADASHGDHQRWEIDCGHLINEAFLLE